ncbi:MAG TPA: class I SAM-dependent methyltransferase [Chryseolinea sp.]|nr:class I SAM-dependent methyltransferase [Chryseolinea sp.]
MKFEGRELYNAIGTGYDLTRRADPFICDRLMHFLSPEKGAFYLDIGCGTGNYTIDLNAKGLKFYGVDPSSKMLEEAMFKSQKIKWLEGTAESISVEGKIFAGAIAVLTLHHWLDFPASFSEINRVLKLRGRFIIFTALPEQMENYWLRHYFPEMMRHAVKQMPSLKLINQAMYHTGFRLIQTEKYFVQGNLRDLFLYSGKDHPAIYLDEDVRSGISSFAYLSTPEELQMGLKHLASDLANGTFNAIRQRYNDALGDYSFLVLEKMK